MTTNHGVTTEKILYLAVMNGIWRPTKEIATSPELAPFTTQTVRQILADFP